MNLLGKIITGENLSFNEAYELFGELTKEEEMRIAAYLAAFQTKGYTGEEIAGLAKAMRDSAIKLELGDVADTAGTGGDGTSTINVSTASALILSAFTKVAKHGNTSVTSKSGSADVLRALDIDHRIGPERARKMIEEVNFTFIFAPLYHPALKRIMPVRKALRIKTVFNILGPLANPAEPAYQLLGVNSEELLEKMASALRFLGVKRALVVHGSGMDEVNPYSTTEVVEVRKGKSERYTIAPDDFGIAPVKPIPCHSAEDSASRIRMVLAGKGKPEDRNFILINASAALYAAGVTEDFREGVEMAKDILGEKMLKRLEAIACLSRG